MNKIKIEDIKKAGTVNDSTSAGWVDTKGPDFDASFASLTKIFSPLPIPDNTKDAMCVLSNLNKYKDSSIKTILYRAVKLKLMTDNLPLSGISTIKHESNDKFIDRDVEIIIGTIAREFWSLERVSLPHLGILLIVATNFRMGEVIQLTLENLEDMLRNQPIYIKLKKRSFIRILIHSNNPLLQEIYNKIQRSYTDKHKPLLTGCGPRTLNRFLKGKKINNGSVTLRKFNVSTLLSGNLSLDAITAFTRHSKLSTTLDHYQTDLNNQNIIQRVYTRLCKMVSW